eukprot:7520327-Pyramimonas_sp.AAC.1
MGNGDQFSQVERVRKPSLLPPSTSLPQHLCIGIRRHRPPRKRKPCRHGPAFDGLAMERYKLPMGGTRKYVPR